MATNKIMNLKINIAEKMQNPPVDSKEKDLNQAFEKKCEELFIKVNDVFNDVNNLLSDINKNDRLVNTFDKEIITQKERLEGLVDDICETASDLTKNPFPDNA